jgi:NADP-dependent 3-hydroxy acid dehydrogenase YdfG
MSKTIDVFGAGPGMGCAVARRFGREGIQVALAARNQTRLDAFTGELAADGVKAAGFAGDLADADAASFEFPLDLLLRTPVTLIRRVLPGMLERGDGAVPFGPPVKASVPIPPFGNLAPAAAAARHYLHTLNTDLAGTGVYAGLLQISGPVSDSDAGNYLLETYGAANLPEPQKPRRPRRRHVGPPPQARQVRPSLRTHSRMTPAPRCPRTLRRLRWVERPQRLASDQICTVALPKKKRRFR